MAAGADIMGVMPSPITGSAGNIEFLLHARTPGPDPDGTASSGAGSGVADLIDHAVAEAHGEKGTG